MRMTSLQSNSDVLTACYLLHVSRLLGPTLRPSAPVCRCHQDSWTRGSLALAQEAVRCPPSLSVSLFDPAPVDLCKVIQATFDEFLFKRCVNVKALDSCEFVSGISHISGAYTVLDR